MPVTARTFTHPCRKDTNDESAIGAAHYSSRQNITFWALK
jgi:hypothetical protein